MAALAVIGSDGTVVAIIVGYLAAVALIAVGFGFGGRAIMRSKGRSGATGFCMGFFLGVLGLLIAALISPTSEHEASRLQRQMQLMGISPTVGQPWSAAQNVAPSRTHRRGSIPFRIAAGFAVTYALIQIWNAFKGFDHLFGSMPEVLLATVCVVAVIVGIGGTQGEGRVTIPVWWTWAIISASVLGGLAAIQYMSDLYQPLPIPVLPIVAGTALSACSLYLARRDLAGVAIGWSIVVIIPDLVLTLRGYEAALPSALGAASAIGFAVLGFMIRKASVPSSLAGSSKGFSEVGSGVLTPPPSWSSSISPPPPPPHSAEAAFAPLPAAASRPEPIISLEPKTLRPVPALPTGLTVGQRSFAPDVEFRREAPVRYVVVFANGDRIPLAATVVIGRNPADVPDQTAHAIADPLLSKTHLKLGFDANGPWVQDCGSKNGTETQALYGGVQTIQPGERVPLASGCFVLFGDNSLVVQPIAS